MKKMLFLPVLIISTLILFIGCDNDTSNGPVDIVEQTGDMTCLDCHSSETMLQEALGEEGSKVAIMAKDDG